MASGAENSEVPYRPYTRLPPFTPGLPGGSKADGYTVTAEYTGEVSRMTEGKVLYSIVYEEVQPEEEPFPWRTTGLVILAVGIAASAGVGLFYLVLFRKKRKAGKALGDPYADRPKLHRGSEENEG